MIYPEQGARKRGLLFKSLTTISDLVLVTDAATGQAQGFSILRNA